MPVRFCGAKVSKDSRDGFKGFSLTLPCIFCTPGMAAKRGNISKSHVLAPSLSSTWTVLRCGKAGFTNHLLLIARTISLTCSILFVSSLMTNRCRFGRHARRRANRKSSSPFLTAFIQTDVSCCGIKPVRSMVSSNSSSVMVLLLATKSSTTASCFLFLGLSSVLQFLLAKTSSVRGYKATQGRLQISKRTWAAPALSTEILVYSLSNFRCSVMSGDATPLVRRQAKPKSSISFGAVRLMISAT